ncbi:hypothetical protein UCRPA7_5238 [Phaeoacremonium minimum UCRPA7]|uniref:CENP-V/GFA domain-containing protein n=1 Tax=Phaeoacremonium minimum (strain UCR-PA7) TaxID=1286976 RepID=R8BIU5_PHAM7|nr:hypothetical protein UCRPA7_5238 [Phaeoacremonium minimum UCRPA7]EON99248.1 hypothetical protein UCRPA7_5238 [Phaeoacremonium minimum UCRPA7]
MPLPPDPVEIRGGCNCGAIRYKIKVPAFDERPIHFTFPSAAKADPATPRLPLIATDLCNDCRSATSSILPTWILCPGDFFTISCLPKSTGDDGAPPAQLHKRPLVNRAVVASDDSGRPAFVPAYEMLRGGRPSQDTWLQLYVSTDEETNHKTGRDSFRSFCGRCGTNIAYTVAPMPPGMPDSKQLLEFIFTSFSHVWCNGDKATVLMWAATPGTSLFKPFQAFPYSFTVLKRQLLTPDVAVIDVILGAVDRELLEQDWMRPERHLWWRYGVPWVQDLLMGGLPAPRHPIYSVHDVVQDEFKL